MLFLHACTSFCFPINHIISRTFYIHRNPVSTNTVPANSTQMNIMPTYSTPTNSAPTYSNSKYSTSTYTQPQSNIYPEERIIIGPLDHITFSTKLDEHDTKKHSIDDDSSYKYDKEHDKRSDDDSDYNDYKGGKEKEKRQGFFSGISNTITDFFQGFTIIKMLIFILIVFLAVALGYQLRKNEESSNFVRLPATQ